MAIRNHIKPHELVGETFDSIKTHRKEIALIVCILIGIPLVVLSFGQVNLGDFATLGFRQQMELINGTSTQQLGPNNLGVYADIANIWLILGSILINGLLVLYVFQKEKGSYTTNASLIMEFLKKIPKLIGTNIMMVLALMVLFLLLVIPGIIYSVFWTFAIAVVLYYGSWGKVALSRSKALITGRWWKTLGTLIVGGLIVFGLSIIQTAILWVGYRYIGWNPVIDLLANVVGLLTIMFSAFYTAHMFLSWKDSYVETLKTTDKETNETATE